MHPLKIAIFAEIKLQNDELREMDNAMMNKTLFHHPNGLRLSAKGFASVRKVFTVYSFEIPESIRSKHYRALSNLEYPYFFTKRRLYIFSELDAMTIKLSGGIERFLENCAVID